MQENGQWNHLTNGLKNELRRTNRPQTISNINSSSLCGQASRMRIAIHQPNFFPHYGFFEKMLAVDKFIILTHCQFEKNNYQNRFRFEDRWYTMSIKHGNVLINEKQYNDHFMDWRRIKEKLPQFNLEEFNMCIEKKLWATNTNIISRIALKLGIKTEIEIDFETQLNGTERLLEICKYYEADTYLSGASGKTYMDLKLFEDAGIKVIFQEPRPSKPILEVLYA